MRRLMVVLVMAAVLSVGCTNVAMTSQQAQDLAYMSGYATMGTYLVAQKPAVEKVQAFKAGVDAIAMATGTSVTTSDMGQANAYNLVNAFVAANPMDPQTAVLLQGILPPLLVESELAIQQWISTQPNADQAKTVQLVFIAAMRGVDDACSAYLRAVATPPPGSKTADIAVPIGTASRNAMAQLPTRRLMPLWALTRRR